MNQVPTAHPQGRHTTRRGQSQFAFIVTPSSLRGLHTSIPSGYDGTERVLPRTAVVDSGSGPLKNCYVKSEVQSQELQGSRPRELWVGLRAAGPSPRYDAADAWRLSLRLRPGQLRGRTAVRRRRAMMPACSHFVLRHSLPPPSCRPLRSPHWYGVLLVLHSSEMCLCPRRYSRPTRRRARGLRGRRAGWPGRAHAKNWT